MRAALISTLVAGLASAMSCAVAAPLPPTIQELGRLTLGFDPWMRGPFPVADFDHDGADDIVIGGRAGQDTLVQVYGRRSGGYASKQMLVLPGTGDPPRIVVHALAGQPHLYVFMPDGLGYEFAGWPLQQVRAFDLGVRIDAAVVGDVDHDGQDELVVSSGWWDGLEILDLATLAVRWADPDVHAGNLLLAQLDADPALEIVTSGAPGVIIDGATHATEWTYKDGFGDFLAPYHGGNTPEFVGAHAWNSLAVFQSQPYSPLWDISVSNVGAIDTYDFDGDGKDEIIEGDDQWGSVVVYDGQTHEPVLSIPHSSYSSSAVGAVDLDHDGTREIAYEAAQTTDADDEVFALYDGASGEPLWRLDRGPSAPYAGASVLSSATGGLRFLFAATPTYPYAPHWVELDGIGGTVVWQSGAADTLLPQLAVAAFALPDAGAGAGFVLAGRGSPQWSIVAVDDATHAVRWRIGSDDGEPLADGPVVAMAAIPRPGAAPDTGLACLEQSGGGSRLFAFRLADGQSAWQSVLMSSGCTGVMAGDFGGGSRLLVAVLGTTLRAYDATTHLLAWSLPEPADGATLLDGVAGREFVVFHDAQLTFHDASTRTVLRQFDLGEPVTAVQELGSIHALIVAAGGRLRLVDGADGTVLATSDFLSSDLGAGNQLAVQAVNGRWFVGAVGSAGAFRYLVAIDHLFANGFDG